MKDILIFDSKNTTSTMVSDYLSKASLLVEHATCLDTCYKLLEGHSFCIVFCSLPLCGYERFALCDFVHEQAYQTKIMVGLQEYTVKNRIEAFAHHADDVIQIPYDPMECFLRLKRLIKVKRVYNENKVVINDACSLLLDKALIEINGNSYSLRKKELEMLHCLVEHKNQIISKERLMRWVWGGDCPSAACVDVTLRRLRVSLGKYSKIVETVKGIGYRLADEVLVLKTTQ